MPTKQKNWDEFTTETMQISKTDEQKAICNSIHPYLIVEANAGTGKTTTAVMKIAQLIADGMNPRKIVALSFSEPGVQAYYDAFHRVGISLEIANAIRVGTFEDFCVARLKAQENIEVSRLKNAEDVRASVLAAIPVARKWAADKFDFELSIQGAGELAVEGLLNEFAQIKGTLQLRRQGEYFQLSPECANEIGRDFTTLAVYTAYENQRRNFVDADGAPRIKYRYWGDATYDLARMLDENSWGEVHPLELNLDAVFLDEMHDTNWAMFTVLKELLIVNAGVKFLGIGDRDQTIHTEHGAESYFMSEGFKTYIGEPELLKLTETYRFGKEIALPLSKFSEKKYPANRERSSKVEVKKADSTLDLLALINDAITRRPGLRPDSPKSQLAVLLRNPSAFVELEHELRSRATRYKTVGFTTYLERPGVLFVRTLLSLAVGLPDTFRSGIDNLAKRATWAFISSTSSDGVGAQIENAAKVENAEWTHFFEYMLPDALGLKDTSASVLRWSVDEAMRTRMCQALDLAASDDIKYLAEVFNLLDIRKLARHVFVKTQEAEDAVASLEGLLKASGKYGSISQFLRSLHSHDRDSRERKFEDDRIVLSDIESAKGLEFEHVVIPDLNATDFDGSIRDERNLFYVAVSRARSMLTLSYQSGKPSTYLRYFETT